MELERQSLTQKLKSIVNSSGPEGLCLSDLTQSLDHRAHALVCVLLCLPFIAPVPLPGVSSVVAIFVMVISLAIISGWPPYLPFGWNQRRIPKETLVRLLSRSEKVLHRVEKILKPRFIHLALHPIAVRVHGGFIFVCAVLLALPAPPGGNALPGLAIIVLSLALIEEDGLFSLIGFFLVGVNIVAFATIYYFVIEWALRQISV